MEAEATQARVSEAPTSKKEITISEQAVVYAKQRLAQRGTLEAAIRLGIKGGGCSGFSYVVQFDDDPPRERDYVYEAGGVNTKPAASNSTSTRRASCTSRARCSTTRRP
jgi:hypothetical protein